MCASSLLEAARDGRPADDLLRAGGEALTRLETVAETFWARGEIDDAVGVAAIAAWLATQNHPGVLASPRLEAVLSAISRDRLPQATAPAQAPVSAGGRERVLLIATETYEFGAHTRLLWRWIARDPARTYSVATTHQTGSMPSGVAAAVADSGGEIVDLPPSATPLQRARLLRELASGFDLIALLDHPHDPVPTLALAGMERRPPVVMMNHADHMFWLGRCIVDVLICTRRAGVGLASRRGVPRRRTMLTPFPVSGPDGHGRVARAPVTPGERARARRLLFEALGWPDDTVLLVTVGAEYKYEGAVGQRLLDLVEPVLEAAPRARLLAAGPGDDGQWARLRERTGGRVLAIGRRSSGIEALHMAADVYLESRPFGGPGSAAEAAAHGVPVLGGAICETDQATVFSDGTYVSVGTGGVEAYRSLLAQLIGDERLRSERGEWSRQAIWGLDSGWNAALERVYALAHELGPVSIAEFTDLPRPGDLDILIDYSNIDARRQPPSRLEHVVSAFEAMVRLPGVRQLFAPFEECMLRQTGRYAVAFAAPGDEPQALRLVIEEFRHLHVLGLAERFVIALHPAAADGAVPVLEAALAAGRDVDIDVVLDQEPARVCPAGALLVDVTPAAAPAQPATC